MEPSTELVDRILTDAFAEVARTFVVDGRGVAIERVEMWEEDPEDLSPRALVLRKLRRALSGGEQRPPVVLDGQLGFTDDRCGNHPSFRISRHTGPRRGSLRGRRAR
jgi:hypothetical protein